MESAQDLLFPPSKFAQVRPSKKGSLSLEHQGCPGQHLGTGVSSAREGGLPGGFVTNYHGLCQHKVRNPSLQAEIAYSLVMRYAILPGVLLASSP